MDAPTRAPNNDRFFRAAGWGALATITATGLSAALILSQANAAPTEQDKLAQRNAQAVTAAAPLPANVNEARRLGDTFSQVAERASRSVVAISIEARREQQSALRFFGQGGDSDFVRGGGSGIIMRSDGIILTNNHVVKDATRIEVVLRDGRKLRARVLGTDEATDLAVLKVDATGLPAIAFANSSQARVGEWVLAIGSPFGLNYTLTAGVLSATGRGGLGANEIEDYLQTDASINPGNSGGPLINLSGEVLGINTMIIGRGSGIGFAIPSNLARSVGEQLAESGTVKRAWIGVAFQELTPELANSLGASAAHGALVSSVSNNGPAKQAGIRAGDIVTSVDDQPVTEGRDLLRAVLAHRVGASLKLGVLRDGQRMNLSITTAERPTDTARSSRGRTPQQQGAQPTGGFGLALEPLSPDIARQLNYQGEGKVVIVNVTPGSAADRADLKRGDVITNADRRAVQTPNDVAEALKDGQAMLQVERGDAAFFVVLSRE